MSKSINGIDSVDIRPLEAADLPLLGSLNGPFLVTGRAIPRLEGGRWSHSEELFDSPGTKTYPENGPEDGQNYAEYIGRDDRAVFLAFDGEEAVGRMIIRADWNKYAFIEDIAVRWAAERGLGGLALETQDTNLGACRFYKGLGMEIGGVNTMLYKNMGHPYCDEIAIFWYKTL